MRSRRGAIRVLATSVAALFTMRVRAARGFGEAGAFHPRALLTGNSRWEGARTTAPGRWAAELLARTSAPAKTVPGTVRADEPALLAEPFVLWGGETEVAPLSEREVSTLRDFVTLGGIVLSTTSCRRRERLTVALSESSFASCQTGCPSLLARQHSVQDVLPREARRRADPWEVELEAIIRGGVPQVIFSSHDLLGALSRDAAGMPAFQVTPGGEAQREQAVRLAINRAMYVLCSTRRKTSSPVLLQRRRSVSP